MVKDGVAHTFHVLIMMFHGILMLMIWFTLPAPHPISMKDILDFLLISTLALSLRRHVGALRSMM